MQETTDHGELIAVSSLQDYFRQSVERVVRKQGVALDLHAEHYVVNLLTLFARSDQLFEDRGDYYGVAPLAVMLAEAADAPSPEDRAAQLRRLGDVALFVAGCLYDSLHDAAVDHSYYIRMGGGAYASLSDELGVRAQGAIMAKVYCELAAKFQPLVDVLNEVCESTSARDQDVVRLYAYWQRTGSKEALAKLRAHNIRPMRPSSQQRH